MTPADEAELHRLAKMLESLEGQLPESSPLREGLVKAGIALSFAFIRGGRTKIEDDYEFLTDLKNQSK